jgi:hypothetical protein
MAHRDEFRKTQGDVAHSLRRRGPTGGHRALLRRRQHRARIGFVFPEQRSARNERAPALLAWLIGTPRTIVFDEDSHGVSDRPGVASLVRKYGLHGVAAGLALIAALFVWKNMSRFIPPLDDPTADGDLVRGKEAGEGFINLLRRSIAPNRVLAVCAEEWKKAFDHAGKVPSPRISKRCSPTNSHALPASATRSQLIRPSVTCFPKRNEPQHRPNQRNPHPRAAEVRKVIIGQDDVVDKALIAIFTGHHALIEGVPGVAKTLLVRTLARVPRLPVQSHSIHA